MAYADSRSLTVCSPTAPAASAGWKRELARWGFKLPPELVRSARPAVARRFVEFFACRIRNRNTRLAYAHAVARFLGDMAARGVRDLARIRPTMVAAYVERLEEELAAPSVKQHLAAIRMLFDWLVITGALIRNPAASVRGPKFFVKRGKTPALSAGQARKLLDSIDTSTVVGLRDRAIIALMLYGFARVGAVVGMRVEDCYADGCGWWSRLHEKGGKRHVVPAHHKAKAYVDTYLEAAGIGDDIRDPLFRATRGRSKALTPGPLTRSDVLRMVKRRARTAGLPSTISCHAFRATAITVYLANGGSIEHAQAFAAHESARTTRLYDRRDDKLNPEEIERIAI
jgi:integrase